MALARPKLTQEEARQEVVDRIRYNALHFYRPYPKQFEFHAAGAGFRERLLMKGNQLGGTLAGAAEVAFHATGEYPSWWPGYRYDGPIVIWCGSETNEKSKEIIQTALLGMENPDRKSAEFGTGMLPRDTIVSFTVRQAGVKNVVDTIIVNHYNPDGVKDGTSQITLKNYQQGVEVWTGKKVDLVWNDEEPKHAPEIYAEALTRTNAAKNKKGERSGRIFMTFTPHNGQTEVVEPFIDPKPGDSPKSLVTMSIYEVLGGVWEIGTPWEGQAWKGHYTREEADSIIAAYPAHERECRAYGVPQAGEGRVFTAPVEDIRCAPFEIPAHYRRIKGIDFGVDHPFGLADLAHDTDNDIIYVTRVWRKSMDPGIPAVPTHAAAINASNEWVPVAWPHDGGNRESDGEQLQKKYKRAGVNMLSQSARYDDDKGGKQAVVPIVDDMDDRMKTGRFRIFDTCNEFFEEYRFLHRKKGIIVAKKDDVLKAAMYALMMIRKAKRKPMPQAIFSRPKAQGLRNWT